MSKYTKGQLNKSRRKFAKSIIDGDSQRQAYKKAFPDVKDTSVQGNASNYYNKESTQALIKAMEAQLTVKDSQKIAQKITKDAIGMRKDVVYDAKGNKTSIKDNQATIASREQYLRLVGHPSFVKNTTLNIDARQVNISGEVAQGLIESIDRLDTIDVTGCSQEGCE